MASTSEDRQQAYYDSIASTYDQHHGSRHSLAYRASVLDRLFAQRELAGVRLLDAMCGGGQNSVYFAARGAQITGVDISESQCEHFRARLPNASVLCRSALDTGLPDKSFDLVITDSLHHLHPHLDAGVRELGRLLRSGGSLVAWEPAAGSLLDRARKVWYRLDRRYFEDNEASIDAERLAQDHADELRLAHALYGGNLGYLLVAMSMPMRIPLRWVDAYAEPMIRADELLSRWQGPLTSLWVLLELVKR